MGARMNRFNRVNLAAWKRRAAGYAGLAVVALLLLGFVVSFLKTLFWGAALVGAIYVVWVLTRKNRTSEYENAAPLDLTAKAFKAEPSASKESDARARLAELKKQRNA